MLYGTGFYKLDGDLLYAPQFILSSSYELVSEMKDSYQYPVDGWYWFDTLEEACVQFNLDPQSYLPRD